LGRSERAALEWLEGELASGATLDPLPPLALLAGRDLEIAEDELNAALRRALLLAAAGGDPHRALDLDDRAVTALAAELDAPERRRALTRRLLALGAEAEGLPLVAATAEAMAAAPERAWHAYACGLLAAELGE
jgi:hypothetical protein